MAAAFTVGLAVVIIGIHRSEHGKRLTGRPDGLSEALARRLLVGSRGCDPRDDAEDGADEQDDRPFRRRGRSSARHCTEPGCAQVPRPVPLAAAQGVALPQVPEPFRPRPEEVM